MINEQQFLTLNKHRKAIVSCYVDSCMTRGIDTFGLQELSDVYQSIFPGLQKPTLYCSSCVMKMIKQLYPHMAEYDQYLTASYKETTNKLLKEVEDKLNSHSLEDSFGFNVSGSTNNNK